MIAARAVKGVSKMQIKLKVKAMGYLVISIMGLMAVNVKLLGS
jgi:hypothetical protein